MKLNQKAITLIELMIGIAIILVVVSGALLSFTFFMLLNDASRNLMIGVNDAQYVFEQMKALDYSQLASYSAPTFTNLPAEQVTFPVTNIGATIATITVRISWTERGSARDFSLTTCFAK